MAGGSYFRTVNDAERLACRMLSLGLALAFLGIVMMAIMTSNKPGFIMMITGGAITLASTLLCVLVSKISADTQECHRCSRPIPVFRDDQYVKCPYCGYVLVLRE